MELFKGHGRELETNEVPIEKRPIKYLFKRRDNQAGAKGPYGNKKPAHSRSLAEQVKRVPRFASFEEKLNLWVIGIQANPEHEHQNSTYHGLPAEGPLHFRN